MILRDKESDYHKIGNMFASTIFVLVSAVQKISMKQKIECGTLLYRGLGGLVDLPSQFYANDENGCKGFCEWGFMSTTSDKNIALRYSGVEEKRPKPTVLVVKVSSVDRGACIKSMSQYQDEIEYLWLPCSFVEENGPKYLEVTDDGAVTMIPVKINCNLKLLTVEDFISQKKKQHLQSFHFLQADVKSQLEDYSIKLTSSFETKDLKNLKNSYLDDLDESCKKFRDRKSVV